jgi:hypothetical protein
VPGQQRCQSGPRRRQIFPHPFTGEVRPYGRGGGPPAGMTRR